MVVNSAVATYLVCEFKCKCLYWQRDWGDVPKALTEDTEMLKKASKK